MGVDAAGAHERERAQQIVDALDLDHSSQPADQEGVGGTPSARSFRSRGRRCGRPSLEVESETDDGDPIRGSDAQAHEVVAHLGADRDQCIARGSEAALDAAEGGRCGRPEVPAQDVPVVGVDDRPGRAAPAS